MWSFHTTKASSTLFRTKKAFSTQDTGGGVSNVLRNFQRSCRPRMLCLNNQLRPALVWKNTFSLATTPPLQFSIEVPTLLNGIDIDCSEVYPGQLADVTLIKTQLETHEL